MTQFHDAVRDRLVRYAKIDTQSQANVPERPSTRKQFDLAYELEKELKQIGASGVWLDEEHCVLYAYLPANTEGGKPIGYIAHMDTAPDADGDCKPWVFENYPGGDITLNPEKNIVMKVSDFPNLNQYIGQDLVLTDGTTLLGGDDKASIAAIMTMAEYYLNHPEIPHGKIVLAFTPDEEVGGLARDLDLERFGADIAYTLDGDYLGYYEYETFNAIEAQVRITGRSVHTGTAKGIMVNAADIGGEFMNMLPKFEKPQYTEGREGFYHMVSIQADCEHAYLRCIIRDHDELQFSFREDYVRKCVDALNRKYGEGTVTLAFANGYRSMKKVIDQVPYMVEYLDRAIREAGVEPHCIAFRGGTDGSALSQRGLPCPNLSAGYENAHGRFEYVPVQSMEKNVEILLKLNEIYRNHKD